MTEQVGSVSLGQKPVVMFLPTRHIWVFILLDIAVMLNGAQSTKGNKHQCSVIGRPIQGNCKIYSYYSDPEGGGVAGDLDPRTITSGYRFLSEYWYGQSGHHRSARETPLHCAVVMTEN